MARKYGPTRGELIFRSVFSAAGLALLGVALAIRGVPEGPAIVEVVGLGALVFGGTLVLSLWRLWHKDHP